MTDRQAFKQKYHRAALLAALFLTLLPLSACGKKPNQVDPPPGAKEDAYPRTYPDPADDPKP